MSERRGSSFSPADFGLLVLSLVILGCCVGYLRTLSSQPAYGGLSLSSDRWQVLTAPDCSLSRMVGRDSATQSGDDVPGRFCLEAGDFVTDLGGLDFETYRERWNEYLYRGREADGSLTVTAEREGQVFQVVLAPGEQTLGVGFLFWAMPLLFWVVGGGVSLLVRPRNVSWGVLLALFYSTAVWIAAGLLSYFHVGGSVYVFHAFIWFFLPLLIHTHLVVPYPVLAAVRRWLLPILYVSAALAMILDFTVGVHQRAVNLWFLAAILATCSLLLYRLRRGSSQTQRMVDRIMLLGVALGLLPLVILSAVPTISADSEVRGLLGDLSSVMLVVCLPIWPLSYLYALYKYSSGAVQLRANRLLGTYGFFCLAVTSFLVLYGLGDRFMTSSDGRAALALGLAIGFVVVSPVLWRQFQKFVDRTIYGIEYLPDEIIGVFAARIPTASDFSNLRSILLQEVLPTLMIRESALFVWSEDDEPVRIYATSDSGQDEAAGLEVEEEALRAWRLQESESPQDSSQVSISPWVRLAVPLRGRDSLLGVWLLGSRDPDDAYPRSDRKLLRNVANQIAPVVENIRLVERAQREVEENRKLQQQLIQSQKMEAIGRLSAGVAHDFNNLLSVILGYSSLLLVKYKGDDVLTGYLDDIRDAGDRAASLTRQLLAFSRQQVMEARSEQLNHVVADVERMLQRLTGEDVQVRTRLADDLPKVRVDPAQMGQVVMNLAVNARDAMPEGGVFELVTERVQLDQGLHDPIQGEIPAGDYVVLTVSDTGVGMAQDQLHLIFEPYFTTKELGKGTGLGLSMVYGIVSQFRGHIWVESELGSGTRFAIYLPAQLGEDSSVGIRSPFAGDQPARGSETILVVEDEDSVRHVACEILEGQGYRVASASDGTDALKVCDEMEAPPDLLLTDVVMPQMKGTDLAIHLKKKHPELQVLFMSGYNEESVFSGWRGADKEERPALIAKPFSPSSLLAEVRSQLDRGSRTAGRPLAPSSTE